MRLIDLDTLNLVDHCTKQENYCVVSYVWGKMDPCKRLCGRNINKNSFVAFETAASIAKIHEIKWLWIDAVCILQDNDEDKQKEVGQMGKYYSNAKICIAIVDELTNVCSLDDNYVDTVNTIDNSCWIKRGWTLQELLLPKKVVFTSPCMRPDSFTVSALCLRQNILNEANKSKIVKLSNDRRIMDLVENVNSFPVVCWMREMLGRDCKLKEDTMYCLLGLVTTEDVNEVQYDVGLGYAFEVLRRVSLRNGDGSVLGAYMRQEGVYVLSSDNCTNQLQVKYSEEDNSVIIKGAKTVLWSDMQDLTETQNEHITVADIGGTQMRLHKVTERWLQEVTGSRQEYSDFYFLVLSWFDDPFVTICRYGAMITETRHERLYGDAKFVTQTGAQESMCWHVVACSEDSKILFPAIWFNDMMRLCEKSVKYSMEFSKCTVRDVNVFMV